VRNFQERLMEMFRVVIPNEAYIVAESTLEDIIKNQNSGLLSFGFVLATLFSPHGVFNLVRALNKSSLYREGRSSLTRRLVALALSFAIVIALSASIAVFTISGMVISYLKEQISYDLSWFWTFSIKSTRWIILFAFYFLMVSML